jgi:hypothetical protein
MNKINNYLLGADFELFLFDKDKNEVINAKKYVKGTKEKPFNFDKSNQFWCTSLDNISMEGNIPPCTTGEEFSKSIERVINFMNSKLPPNMVTVHDPAVYVNPAYLNTKEARTLGCMETMNAYTLHPNDPPNGESTNLRTCCTHIHLSYDNINYMTSVEWIKACDLFLGIPSLIIEPSNPRRELYGKAGEFRFNYKTVEYRVLSSYFSQSEELRKWVFNNAVKAIDFINEGHNVNDISAELQQAITTNDTNIAKKLIEQFNIPLPQ